MSIVGQIFKWFPSVLNSMLIHKKSLETNIIRYRVHYYFVWRRMAGYLQFILFPYYSRKYYYVWCTPKTKFISCLRQYLLCVLFIIFFHSLAKSICFHKHGGLSQTIKHYWNSSCSISRATNYHWCSHIDSPSKSQYTVINHSVVLGYCLSVFHPSKDI